jgi:hypothetical protein
MRTYIADLLFFLSNETDLLLISDALSKDVYKIEERVGHPRNLYNKLRGGGKRNIKKIPCA